MAWFKALFLGSTLYGLWWSYPILAEFDYLAEDAVVPSRTINAILVFLGASLVWAVYLALVFVPWIAQCFLDILYSLQGGSLSAPETPQNKTETNPEKPPESP
jgi:hypothetical protein